MLDRGTAASIQHRSGSPAILSPPSGSQKDSSGPLSQEWKPPVKVHCPRHHSRPHVSDHLQLCRAPMTSHRSSYQVWDMGWVMSGPHVGDWLLETANCVVIGAARIRHRPPLQGGEPVCRHRLSVVGMLSLPHSSRHRPSSACHHYLSPLVSAHHH